MMPLFELWSNLRLRAKGLIVVAFPATATVLIACAGYVLGSRAENAERAVHGAIDVREEISALRTSEIESSAAARGYFVTGDDRFAARLRQSLADFDARRQKLALLTAGNPAQQRRLDQIASVQRSRVERIYDAMARFHAGALAPGDLAQALRTAETERLNLEAIIAGMRDEESRVLAVNIEHAQALRSKIRAVIGVCALLGVAGGLVISSLFASGITSRIGKLETNVARLATGGTYDAGTEGHDEIGSLSAGLARTAQILHEKTAALENALHGIAQADASGRYVSFNKACGKLLGLSPFCGPSGVLASVRPEDRPAVEQAIARMRADGRAEVEARVPRPDGSAADVVMTFLPATADPTGGYHIFLRDITMQKETEAALIRAKDAAVASNRAKTEFLAKISHDIRTPLNAILGAADLLSRTPLDRDQEEYVSMFQRNCERLVALINDFLDFSRIEAGAVRVERIAFRARQIVDDVVRTFHESAARKRVALTVEIAPIVPEWLMGDPLRIQQVLANLLSNALKFIRQGKVAVRLLVAGEATDQCLRFEVEDTGPGISPADQEKIFAPFTQLPNQGATSIRGSGLGLTICRELLQLMNGEIGVTSAEGSGSTFYFQVPLERAPHNLAHAAGALVPRSLPELRNGQPLRILAAEDTEDNRMLLRHYLRDQPVTLEFVQNGQEAVETAQRSPAFDLILMDIDMPELDGRAATAEIRAWEASSGRTPAPIVALSAHAIREEVRACLDAGCVAHIAKPVNQATLLEAIQRYARAPVAHAVRSNVSSEIATLIPAYLASKSREIEEALSHLARRDFKPIWRFGHNLKGTGRGYGFPEIEDLGRAMEKSAEAANESEIAGQLLALHRFVGDLAVRES